MTGSLKGSIVRCLPVPIANLLREMRRLLKLRITADETSPIHEVLINGWKSYRRDLYPVDRRMKVLPDRGVEGMGTENLRFLINEIVRRSAKDGVYLEVGTYRGSSLLSAALFNPSTRCIGIDDFSQFDPGGANERILGENLSKFPSVRNVEFIGGDYRDVCREWGQRPQPPRIDVYFYDGDHSFRSQQDGMSAFLPFLADRCLILVDDVNFSSAAEATASFLKEHPDFRSVLKILTQGNGSPDWWNGFEIMARGF